MKFQTTVEAIEVRSLCRMIPIGLWEPYECSFLLPCIQRWFVGQDPIQHIILLATTNSCLVALRPMFISNKYIRSLVLVSVYMIPITDSTTNYVL